MLRLKLSDDFLKLEREGWNTFSKPEKVVLGLSRSINRSMVFCFFGSCLRILLLIFTLYFLKVINMQESVK